MTLLSICKDAADEIGIDRPSSVISNPEPSVQKLLRASNKVGKSLMKKVSWQALRKEQTFTSLAAELQTGIIPSDFDRFVAETFWDRTNYRLITGPVSPVEWQQLKANSYSDTMNLKFIYRGDGVRILPTLEAGITLAFEYVSENWCQSSGGTGQTAWAADTDTGILDEELLTRGLVYVYLTTEGLPNGVAAQEFQEYFGTVLENDQPVTSIMVAADIFGGGRHFAGAPSTSGGTNINSM